VNVETLTTLDAIPADKWDALVRAAPRPSPFLLHAWVRAWWSHYGEGGELVLHVVRRNGRLAGVLPLCVRGGRRVQVVEFLGGEQAHLADVLAEDDAAAAALVQRAVAHPGDFAALFGMPATSRLAGVRGLRLRERVEAPVLDLSNAWDDVYAAKFSTKTRQTQRRKRRRLAEEGALEARLATTPDEVDRALTETFRLHTLRWAGRPDGSDYTSIRGQAFQREAYRALAEQGVARVLSLDLEGRTVAFNAFLVLNDRLYSHRLGFDPAHGRHSPGLLCTLDMCEWAAAEGLSLVEFLGGDEEYKLQLADRFEPLLEGIGLARTLRGRAAVAARLGTLALRMRLKRMPAVRRLYLALPRRRTASAYAAR
jgi:CelD/BcsL family acetyltransferase involved in cellulose biosynthesis